MTDDALLESARNGFLVMLLALLGVGLYQIATQGTVSTVVGGVWAAGALVFYGSKLYYERT